MLSGGYEDDVVCMGAPIRAWGGGGVVCSAMDMKMM